MKLKIVLISLISILIVLPVTHGAVSVYKDLRSNDIKIEETEQEETEAVFNSNFVKGELNI